MASIDEGTTNNKDVQTGGVASTNNDSTPNVDAALVESKSQKLRRIPPFLKTIAEIDLGEELKPTSSEAAELLSVPSVEDGGAEEVTGASKPANRPALKNDVSKTSEPGQYSRYNTRYTEGSITERPEKTTQSHPQKKNAVGSLQLPRSLSEIDPIGSWVPYLGFTAFSCIVALIWFIVAMVTSGGSVMANRSALTAGIVVLAVMLVLGLLYTALLGYKAVKQWDDALKVDVVLTTVGKMAAAMAIFVVFWTILMFVAA